MREYDQQIGRFFRLDPIAERFYELTPYQYCSNNPIKNVDVDGLEGLDFRIFNKLVENTVKNPNGTSAKVLGAAVGVGGAVRGVVTGTLNAVRHPIQTAKGLAHMLSQTPEQNAVDYAVNVVPQYVGVGSDAFSNYAVGAHAFTDMAIMLSPMKGAFAGAKSPWALAPSARGLTIEGMLGGNLPKAFPVIDKFVDGVATSIKSIDLTVDTYSKGNNLLNTLNGYINKLDNFTYGSREGVTIGSSDITSKVLEVAIQSGKATLGQWEQISKAMQNAKDKGIQFNLQFIKQIFKMPSAAIYKIHKKGYLLHANRKAVSGFSLASEPFIQVTEGNANENAIADAIKAVLNNKDTKRVPNPKNWGAQSKEFLRKTGLKSLKELNASTTMHCGIRKENGSIVFTPTKHAEKPDEGFVNKSKDEPNIIVPDTASNQDIIKALELAFSKCE